LNTLSNHGGCRRREYASSVAPASDEQRSPGDSSRAAGERRQCRPRLSSSFAEMESGGLRDRREHQERGRERERLDDEPGNVRKGECQTDREQQATYSFKVGRISATPYCLLGGDRCCAFEVPARSRTRLGDADDGLGREAILEPRACPPRRLWICETRSES